MAVRKIILILSLLFPVIGFAQAYSIDWYKIAGGGGTSTDGTYPVSGTIGQPDAGGRDDRRQLFAHRRFLELDLRRANAGAVLQI